MEYLVLTFFFWKKIFIVSEQKNRQKIQHPISKTIVSIFTISYMRILPGVLGMFQLEFFKKFAILTILQRFQNKK